MISWVLLALLMPAPTADDHEYADVIRISASEVLNKAVSAHKVTDLPRREELEGLFQFNDFAGKSIDGRSVNFHLPQQKNYKAARVLLLSYIAEWCKNCNYQAPYIRELYDKYHASGLEIVARSEYSEVEKLRKYIDKHHIVYPVIVGSVVDYDEREKIRLETFQYLLRTALGDSRKWGTPFNIIIVDGDLENPYVVMGELKSDQVNKLIERTLASNPATGH